MPHKEPHTSQGQLHMGRTVAGKRSPLVVGLSLMAILLLAAFVATLVEVSSLTRQSNRILTERSPTAIASANMVTSINASLASLRGWMLTGDINYIEERAGVWQTIDKTADDLERLSKTWTKPDNLRSWQEFKTVLEEFRAAQNNVEHIAHSPLETPATEMLIREGEPRAQIIVSRITELIDLEAEQPATAERKNLLGIMADVRGTMGLSLAALRAFLWRGEDQFLEEFHSHWKKNEQRYNDLRRVSSLLTPQQKVAFEDLTKARTGFYPVAQNIIHIRRSAKWNMARYALVNDAAPRAGQLLVILTGEMGSDGVRKGGMAESQRQLLNQDTVRMARNLETLTTLEWILLVVGIGFAIVAIFFTVTTMGSTGPSGRDTWKF